VFDWYSFKQNKRRTGTHEGGDSSAQPSPAKYSINFCPSLWQSAQKNGTGSSA
jgi:hypothetical protein